MKYIKLFFRLKKSGMSLKDAIEGAFIFRKIDRIVRGG
jgi:hypothetical protein